MLARARAAMGRHWGGRGRSGPRNRGVVLCRHICAWHWEKVHVAEKAQVRYLTVVVDFALVLIFGALIEDVEEFKLDGWRRVEWATVNASIFSAHFGFLYLAYFSADDVARELAFCEVNGLVDRGEDRSTSGMRRVWVHLETEVYRLGARWRCDQRRDPELPVKWEGREEDEREGEYRDGGEDSEDVGDG